MKELINITNFQTVVYCAGLSDCEELVGAPDRKDADYLRTLQA